MKCLVPKINDWQAHFEELIKLPSLGMFHETTLAFLNEVSKKILTNKDMRQYPELIATGYWLRKAHIHQIQQDFSDRFKDSLVRPRGIVFHIAPSNVDSIFLYSWVLSLLAGNANIIRLSSKQDEQLAILLDLIETTLAKKEYRELWERTMVVTYPHDDEMTKMFSRECHVRIIWGGDFTIRSIRSIPLRPIATELVFADRFSSVVLSAEQVLQTNENQFDQLIHNFYNDAFWFQQMACSSPRMIAWIGDKKQIDEAQKRFWNGVQRRLDQEDYSISSALNMTRLSTAFYYGAQRETSGVTIVNNGSPLRVNMNELNTNLREIHCGGGIFLEMSFSRINDLTEVFNEKDQTLSYYGFTKKELSEFVLKLKGRGIDRIVPVGQALDFNEIWDGYHFLTYLTREIDLR